MKTSKGGALISTLLLFSSAMALFSAVSPAFAYKDKKFVPPVSQAPVAGTRVDVDASKITVDSKSNVATATGTVRITYGPYTLLASKVVYDQKHDVFTANGSVEMREPNGNVLVADTTEIRNQFKQGFARHVKMLLSNDVTITSSYAVRQEDGKTIFEHATYTACVDCKTASGAPIWDIVTDKTVHDSNTKTLYYTNPRLRFGGVPVAWLPYGSQPDPTVKRRTGFLLPSLKIGSSYGVGVVTPYFLELGKSADLTFRPRWTTKQGPVADVEYRQALASGEFNVRGIGVRQFTHDSVHKKWRGAVRSKGAFEINPAWNWGWDGTLVSDRRFLDSYDYDGRDLLVNQAFITGLQDRNYFSAKVMEFHTLANNQHRGYADERQDLYPSALPYIDSEYTFDQPILGGEVKLDWNAYYLTRNDADTPFRTIEHGTDQMRSVSNVSWQRQMIAPIGTVITPFARVRSDVYVSKHVPERGTGHLQSRKVTSRVLPSAGVDMRWPLMASYDAGQSIITPVFQAIAATNEKDRHKIGNEDAITINFDTSSLFLQDRFTGDDRYEGGSRINAGVQYSFLGANGGFTRLSLGESFHIAGRNSFNSDSGLGRNRSNLVGSIIIQPWDELSLSYQARVKEDFSKLHMQEALATYSNNFITSNLGYIYLDRAETEGRRYPAKQIEAATSLKLSESWSVFSGLKYDFIHDQFRSRSVGVSFDCDCMTASLTYTQKRGDAVTDKTDHELRLSVDLRTLGKMSIAGGPQF